MISIVNNFLIQEEFFSFVRKENGRNFSISNHPVPLYVQCSKLGSFTVPIWPHWDQQILIIVLIFSIQAQGKCQLHPRTEEGGSRRLQNFRGKFALQVFSFVININFS